MSYFKNKLYMLALAASALIAGCGGGGEGTGTGSYNIVMNTPATLSMTAGATIPVAGSAESYPNDLASMKWTIAATSSVESPLTIHGNADCADATRQSQADSKGRILARWDCTATVTAPANLTAAATFDVQLTASDTAGNKSVSVTRVTVSPDSGVTAKPAAKLTVPTAAAAGDEVIATCAGAEGYTVVPGLYNYQWVATPDLLPLSGALNSQTLKFTAPVVTKDTSISLTCRVTDDNNKVGVDAKTIVVSPLPPTVNYTLVPGIIGGGAVTAGAQIILDGRTTSWYDKSGNPVMLPQPIYYDWQQTDGPATMLTNPTFNTASAIAPQAQPHRVYLTYTLRVSDQPFVNGVSAGTVKTRDVVFYVDPVAIQDSVISLASTYSGTAASNAFVSVPVTADVTPSTTLPLYYQWTQVSGPTVTMGGANSKNLTFVAPKNTTADLIILVFRISVGFSPISVASPGNATLDVIVPVAPATP